MYVTGQAVDETKTDVLQEKISKKLNLSYLANVSRMTRNHTFIESATLNRLLREFPTTVVTK